MSRSSINDKITANCDSDYQHWITERVLVSLYDNALFSITGSFAVFVILAWAAWSQIPSVPLIYWSVSGVLIAIIRLLLLYGFKNTREKMSPRLWLNSYRLMSLCSGILNGMSMWLFFDDFSVEYQLLIFFSIVGLTAASSGTHAVDLPTFQLFMFSSSFLVITEMLTSAGPTDFGLSLMFVLYILVMTSTGRNNNKTLLENFQLTYRMHYRATHDPLSDLLNRFEFEHQFALNTPLTPHGVAFLFLDLDNFKPLNDNFGHLAGDRALQQVAKILKSTLRSDDTIARIGGDEFVAYLYIDDIEEVEKIGQNILRQIHGIPSLDQRQTNKLSGSIGIAFHPTNKVNYSQLLHTADLACYKSKENGKNQVTVKIIPEKTN